MKSKAVQFLEANQPGERSTFVDDAKWRQENASWLRRSRRVAYAIMDYMQAGFPVTMLPRNWESALSM